MIEINTLAWRRRDWHGRLVKETPNPERDSARFWEKVDILGPLECWNFCGCIHDGYGRFRFLGKLVTAHRLTWTLHFGPIPNGLCVCHKCDNRRCCNWDHLFLGTKKDNTLDCIAKGRFPFVGCGENHPRSKLTSEQVIEIRKRHASGGITYYALGREYNVTGEEIMEVVKRHIWKHI